MLTSTRLQRLTIDKIKREVGAAERMPQVVTPAGQVACSDVRMTSSMWIMLRSLTLSLVGNESLDIGIEWRYIDSAAGDAVPLVHLVAVDSLKADEGDSMV